MKLFLRLIFLRIDKTHDVHFCFSNFAFHFIKKCFYMNKINENRVFYVLVISLRLIHLIAQMYKE